MGTPPRGWRRAKATETGGDAIANTKNARREGDHPHAEMESNNKLREGEPGRKENKIN